MKYIGILAGLISVVGVANAEMGRSADVSEHQRVTYGQYLGLEETGSSSGDETTQARYCADRPERCSFNAAAGANRPNRITMKLVSSSAQCSNAGDETARPVYKVVRGRLVFAGYECIQDNRSSN